ncbi:hypothetical protein [Idiomarina sp.]|uniref:hypothetical protein n=1 Tax=Idiomarina sp. TaxID=1874361 RepID=UPI002617E6F5|nr:hypothetical protein [Idiomarina sp.]
MSLAIIAVLILQSLASSWFYPTLMPEALSLNRWQSEWHYLTEPSFNSIWLAFISALLGVIFAVVLLQHQREQKQKDSLSVWVLIALFVPQVPLVLGWQMLLGEYVNQGWNAVWVAWLHTVYTVPYAYLVLHGAYTQFDEQWLGQGLTPTLTTEAVSVASGGDWRIGSLYALLQTLLPLIVFISVGLLNTGLKGKKTKAKRYADYS